MKWALERQAEVAQTEAERIDAMLELAELEETKFLKRELAAQLLEQVLTLEPSHPQALKGLERCYHALRDWPALARILGLRAEHAFEKRAKVELFELAAEVHESKLGDPAGAIEVYNNLLLVDPKHRRALTDLAQPPREKWAAIGTTSPVLQVARRGDGADEARIVAGAREARRLPQHARSRSARSRGHCNTRRPSRSDPTNAAGWEAIQKMAAEAGDDQRVLECL